MEVKKTPTILTNKENKAHFINPLATQVLTNKSLPVSACLRAELP
jgi:hypothetical protein